MLQFTGHDEVALLKMILPAGISFYTFKSMSYTIDVYRKRIRRASHVSTTRCS